MVIVLNQYLYTCKGKKRRSGTDQRKCALFVQRRQIFDLRHLNAVGNLLAFSFLKKLKTDNVLFNQSRYTVSRIYMNSLSHVTQKLKRSY